MNQLRDFFLMYRPQCVFFLVFMAACVPVLFYYRRRNPNPRFRPSNGEMAMVSLFAAALSAGLGFGIGGMFNERQDFKKLAEKPIQDYSGGGGAVRQREGSGEGDSPAKKTDEQKILDALKGVRGK